MIKASSIVRSPGMMRAANAKMTISEALIVIILRIDIDMGEKDTFEIILDLQLCSKMCLWITLFGSG